MIYIIFTRIYIVEVTSKTKAVTAENQDYSIEKGTLLGELRANVEAKLIESLAKAADFKDWRASKNISNWIGSLNLLLGLLTITLITLTSDILSFIRDIKYFNF